MNDLKEPMRESFSDARPDAFSIIPLSIIVMRGATITAAEAAETASVARRGNKFLVFRLLFASGELFGPTASTVFSILGEAIGRIGETATLLGI